MASKWQYEKLTWPEVAVAAQEDRVVLIPVGAVEEHGHHLPLDCDILIANSICRAVAERLSDDVVVLPPVYFGYESLHMDFPGTIHIPWDLFIRYFMAIVKSLAHHGFRRVLIVNGHGGNTAPLDVAAREAMSEVPGILCTAVMWTDLTDVREAFNRVRESEVTSHACELETSAYLALDPDGVKAGKAVRHIPAEVTPHIWRDMIGRKVRPDSKSPIKLMEPWGAVTPTGVRGDATLGTAEKGRLVLNAAVGELAEIVRELKAREILLPRDHHTRG